MSENIGGGLAFEASLDLDKFNVSAEAMERRIRNVSNSAVVESERMDKAISDFAQNGARYIIGTLVGGGMMGLVNSIVQTRGQFQQLQIAFDTILGSGVKSKALMDQLTNTAAKTPFDLMGVAGGAKQLLAYGASADKVNDTLVRLGNIASGLSIPLNDIVYLYGTTMVQGRLYAQDVRQFTGRGIPLVRELAAMYGKTAEEITNMVSEGKVGFPEVEKVINKMTNSGGQFYNLMERQSKSLTGMISNLGDSWDMALNKLGEDNQGILETGISGAITVVEHMDDVLNTVKAIATAYGSYRAAIVLNTLATKGNTGIALIDNTVRQAKIALMKADEVLTGKTAAVTAKMTAAQQAYTLSLQKQLTVEEQANLAKQLRILTIEQLLTAQQQEYLSNLNVTTSSANYEAVAMSVLSVEQREALSKTDLTAKSVIYQAALQKEVLAKAQTAAATVAMMREDVKAAAVKMENAKLNAVTSMQAVESARYQLYWAKQSTDVTRIGTAEKRMEAAVESQAIARKAALAASSDFYAKKKLLETTATRQSTAASVADTAAKGAQTAATSMLTAVTARLSVGLKALWASMMTNPIGWITTAIGLAASAFMIFSSKGDEAKTVQGDFQDATRKASDELKSYMAILQNTDKSSAAHKQALEKVNAMCQEYNKTLLTENSTLADQQTKYQELTIAIQAATAEKIKAKYVEQEMAALAEKQADLKNRLISDAGEAKYVSKTVDYGSGNGTRTIYDNSANIRQASQAVWDAVESMSMEAGDKLKALTGSAYTEAFNKSLDQILKSVQQATGATDKEMDGFSAKVSAYLSKMSGASKETGAALDNLTGQINRMYNAQPKAAVTDSLDYAKMTFEELDKKAKETQSEIDKINAKKVKVEADNTKLTNLLGLLNQVNSAIGSKTKDLNTESGINARIKELKDERENVEINSKKYNELTRTIDNLEAKIPKKTSAMDNKAQQLSEKQIQTELKAEQSRIEIMEDGYDKRKALLDLQHKQNLIQIDKEEKELEKARKEAGKGGLSSKEKSEFGARRANEDASYSKAQNKLFDGEIEYKKSQYELYFRWVKNMGEDVANTHFNNLLKGGNSYKDYVEKEIQKLNEKKATGALSEGEANNLINLTIQYNEITGAKTAMDAFKESVSQAINRASTLAEKIQAIADAKEKLRSGNTGLVGDDDKASASVYLNQQDEATQKELNDKILKEYRTYEEQRLSIQKEYALLRENAIKNGNMSAIAEINKGEAQRISALFTENLMNSEEWKQLFGNLDHLTVSKMIELRDKIESSWSKIELSPEALNDLRNRIDQVTDAIQQKNPFLSLIDAIKRYKEESSKINYSELMEASSAALGATKEAFDSVVSGIKTMGIEMDETTENMLNDIDGVLDGASKLAAGIAEGNPLAIIQGSISLISHGISLLDSGSERRNKRLQEEIEYYNKLVEVYDTLIDKQKELTESLSGKDALQAYQEGIGMINAKTIAARNSLERWFSKGAGMFSHSNWYKYDKAMDDVLSRQKLLTMSAEEWTSFMKDNAKQWNKLPDEVKNYAQKIIDAGLETEELAKITKEALTGFSFDDASNSIMELAGQAELTFKSISGSFSKLMQDAILRLVKSKVIDNSLQSWYDNFSKNMEDGVLSDDEVKARQDEYNSIVGGANEYYKKMMEAAGISIDSDNSKDPTTGAIKSLSEETGGIVAGRLNAVVINQTDGLSLLRQSLLVHQQIAENTSYCRRLEAIDLTLKRIEGSGSSGSSLLSKGIS